MAKVMMPEATKEMAAAMSMFMSSLSTYTSRYVSSVADLRANCRSATDGAARGR
jgi:hypothetical protein